MEVSKTKTLKKLLSWMLGLPATIVVFSEIEDLSLWWIQFVALIVVIAILYWNGAFVKERR